MISIHTNLSALVAQRNLKSSTDLLNQAIKRMTTGFKINGAKDDAAGYSIIENLNTKISSMLQIQENTESGIALLNTASGGLEEIQTLLERLRELATQASNGTYDEKSRQSMQAEADELIEEIKRIKQTVEYDGMNLYETPRDEENVVTAAVMRLAKSANLKSTNNTDADFLNDVISDTFTSKASVFSTKVVDTPTTESATSFYSDTNTLSSNSLEEENAGISLLSLEDEPAAVSTVAEGAVDFAGNETKTVTIDGVEYTVTNNLTTSQTLSYVKDSSGTVEFRGSSFTIKGQLDKSHNLVINGSSNSVYGGDLADTISTSSSSNQSNTFYGGNGNDTLLLHHGGYLYGQSGEDTLTLSNYGTAYGGNNNDTIIVNGTNGIGHGQDGDDTLILKGYGTIYGNAGDDDMIIESNSTGGTVDGGEGTNTLTNNSSASFNLINVPGANTDSITFASKETRTININGISYTITNRNSYAANFMYQIDTSTNQIALRGVGFTIVGDENVAHNVKLTSSNIYFYGGNEADTIISNNSSNIIFGNGGNDNITISGMYNTVYGGSGEDIIKLYNHYSYIDGGGDNDTVIMGSSAYNSNVIYDSDGTNTITKLGADNIVYGFGDSDNADGAILLGGSESAEVEINGINYNIKSNSSFERAVLYSFNAVSKEITFGGNTVTIKGDVAKKHIIKTYGYNINIYGGDDEDIINAYHTGGNVYGQGGNDTITTYKKTNIYGGSGNDTLTTHTTESASIYGEEGDDTLITSVNNASIKYDGGEGDDIYRIDHNTTTVDTGGKNVYYINTDRANISGASGDDTFYISGDNNTVLGGGGKDYFVIDGTGNTVDGGTDDNYYVDNGTGNSYSNSELDPNSGMLLFNSAGESKTFTMAGKTYTVVNNSSDANQFSYSYNQNTKTITITGDNFTVNSDTAQINNINIRGNNNIYNGSTSIDIIKIESGTNNVINADSGNDVLTSNSENNSLNGDDGNDTITLNASSNLTITGGAGSDTINIYSDNNTNIDSGSGNDVINVSGSTNTIQTNDGNNIIKVNGDSNQIESANGANSYTIIGNSNTITAGNGANTLGVEGNENTLTIENIVGDINIYGNNNNLSQETGTNEVVIRGNENTYTSTEGQKNLNVTGDTNTINTGSEDDVFSVKGNSNNIESIGGNNNITLRGDSNNVEVLAGNNEITLRGNSNSVQGGVGIDNIVMSGNGNSAFGGDESDTFLISSGSNNTIDGEGGERNTIINNGKNTNFTNAVDITPRPFNLDLKIGIGNTESSIISTSISFNLFDFYTDLSTVDSALESITKIDEMLLTVENELLNIGTTINRLEMALREQDIKLENMISTRSTLRDADIAEVSSTYIQQQILQQASATLLSTANQTPAIALQLL